MLRPRSIAVVGASPRSFAGSIVQRNCNAHAFTGTVTPINGKYNQIEGVATVPTLLDLEEGPDVVVALVGTARVLGIAEDADAIGAGSLIVPGGGFTDSGAEANELAEGLAVLADKFQMPIVGPNCMGVADLVTGAMPYIGTVPNEVRRGTVAAIAQSGAVIEALVNSGGRVPFSTLVSSGCEASTTTADYLRFFAADEQTTAVLVFIEGFADAPDVLSAAREVAERGKTVAACVVGRSAKAQAGILAHSGKLAPSARVTAAALRQAGVVVASDLDELLAMGELLGTRRSVPGARVHVVTNSGGEANMLADLADDAGLELPEMRVAAKQALGERWPAFHVANPLDPWGVDDYTEVYPPAIEAAAREPGDVLVVSQDQQVTSGGYERELSLNLAKYLAAAAFGTAKFPVLLSPTSQDPDPTVTDFCRAQNIAFLRGATPAFTALGKLAGKAAPARQVERSPAALERLLHRTPITEDAALELLNSLGVQTPKQIRVSDPDAAASAAESIGGAVVVKAVAEGLLHKSDLGLVLCNIYGSDAARDAAKEIQESARAAGLEVDLLVVEQVQGSLDVVVGYTHDPQFGPTTLVGLGGVWTEMLDSVTVHVGALDEHLARDVLSQSKVGRMLSAARGGALHIDGVVHAMCVVSDIGAAHPDVVAIDVNPLIVSRDAAVAVDAVIQRTTDQHEEHQ